MAPGPFVERLIVGGGITGLLAAWRARRADQDASVLLLEGCARPGGVIATVREDGFLVEQAASTLRPGASAFLEVARELGLESELIESSAAAGRRWILRRGKLVAVPSSPLGLVTSPVLSWRAKLRVLREPWIASRGAQDETLADFIARRFGDELVDPLLDAVVTGIFAGDPRRLEAKAAMPKLAEMEAQHGSVLTALRRRRRRAAPTRARPNNRQRLIALRGGMQQLVDRLVAELGDVVQCNARVVRIERSSSMNGSGMTDGARWLVTRSDGASVRARDLLLATPSWISAPLLAPLDPELARELSACEAANVGGVAIGIRREQVAADVDGLGFLVPSSEGTPLLGVLYESSLFNAADPRSARAPAGHVLLRAMVGGERARLPDDPAEIAQLAWRETSRILRITGSPRLLRAVLHRPGIPQYRPGHTARMARVEQRLTALAGLQLLGWSYRGIALDDRARETCTP